MGVENGGSRNLRKIVSYLFEIVRNGGKANRPTACLHHKSPKLLSSAPPTARSNLYHCVATLSCAFLSYRSISGLPSPRVKHGQVHQFDAIRMDISIKRIRTISVNNGKFGHGIV